MTEAPREPDPQGPETQPGHVPQGPQETSPTEDPALEVPLDSAGDGDAEPGQMPDHDTEVGA